MNEFKIKQKKEINRIFLIRVIYCFSFSFSVLLIIYSSTHGKLFTSKHFLIFILCTIPLSILYAFTIEKVGSSLGEVLLGWTSKKISLREQLSADLAKARFSKGNGRFKEAIIIINEVLEKYPKFPEALLLKAQILWEGFENKALALENLDKVIELVKDDDPIHRWALNYYHEIIKRSKN